MSVWEKKKKKELWGTPILREQMSTLEYSGEENTKEFPEQLV